MSVPASGTQSTRLQTRVAIGIVALFHVLIQAFWILVVPLGQSPDEPDHADYVNYLLHEHGLPVLGRTRQSNATNEIRWTAMVEIDSREAAWELDLRWGTLERLLRENAPTQPNYWQFNSRSLQIEAGQPPLYYLLVATMISPVAMEMNGIDRWMLMRVLSALIGSGSVVVAWRLGAWLFPRRRLAGSTALALLVSAMPMPAFLRSMVSNDSMLNLLSATLFLVCLVTRRCSLAGAVIIGMLLGAALLTKASAIAICLSIAWWCAAHWRRVGVRQALAMTLIPASCFVAYLHVAASQNAFHYLDVIAAVRKPLDKPLDGGIAFIQMTDGLVTTVLRGFFGVYGWTSISRTPASQVSTLVFLVGAIIGRMLPGLKAEGRAGQRFLLRWRKAEFVSLIFFLPTLCMLMAGGQSYQRNFGESTLHGKYFVAVLLPILVLLIGGWSRLLSAIRVWTPNLLPSACEAIHGLGLMFTFWLFWILGRVDLFRLLPSIYFGVQPALPMDPDSSAFFRLACIHLPPFAKWPWLVLICYYLLAVTALAAWCLPLAVSPDRNSKRLRFAFILGLIALFMIGS